MIKFQKGYWNPKVNDLPSVISDTCFNCGKEFLADKGYYNGYLSNGNQLLNIKTLITICPKCFAPNVFYGNLTYEVGFYGISYELIDNRDNRYEALIVPRIGKNIKKLPKDISKIYNEIRDCYQVKAYTASVMLMRKLIMHIAIENGANENENFIFYIEYLRKEGIIPPKTTTLIDNIRKSANDINHKDIFSTEEPAKEHFKLLEVILRINYEYNADIKEEEKSD